MSICYQKTKDIENQKPILLSISGQNYQNNLNQLKSLLDEKQQMESGVIKQKWMRRQADKNSRDWQSILVLTGRNSKRLRQVVDLGSRRGLFDLRPCWLTNPNTACQIFPLTPEYFDTVIFDEASQCPIEQALPIIYRAKKIIVAGDEKQLPPTSFWLSSFAVDEEEQQDEKSEDEKSSEEITEDNIQRARIESILHGEDLLATSKNILKDKDLNVHYRSQHPALITFSNHAFYSGRLEVPTNGLTGHYRSEPAIVYKNIGGVYKDETNRDEALAVLELIKKVWDQQPRPSVGVVSFNSKQRDLIQDVISAECERSAEFRGMYDTEKDRKDGKQDVGIFVKNLESVQHDWFLFPCFILLAMPKLVSKFHAAPDRSRTCNLLIRSPKQANEDPE